MPVGTATTDTAIGSMTTGSIIGYTTTMTAATAEPYVISVSDLAADSVATLSEDVLPWASTQSHAESSAPSDPPQERAWTDLEISEEFYRLIDMFDRLSEQIGNLNDRIEDEAVTVAMLGQALKDYLHKDDIPLFTDRLCDLFRRHFETEQFEFSPDELDALLYGL